MFTLREDYRQLLGMPVDLDERFIKLMEDRLPPGLASAFSDLLSAALQRDFALLSTTVDRLDKHLSVSVVEVSA